MIYVTSEAHGLRLTRGGETFVVSEQELPAFLANLISRLTGRADYAIGYQDGLSDGYKRAEQDFTNHPRLAHQNGRHV